jgi:MFS family permease
MRLSPFHWLCGAGLLAVFSSTLSKSPVLPLFAVHLGAAASEVGMVAAASTLAGIAFSIPAGMLSDRLGRRRMLLAAGAVFASAPALYFVAGSLWQLAAIRLYHGLATAVFMPVAMAFVADLHADAKGEKLGWFSTATLLGRFAAPLVGGAFLGHFGAESRTAFAAVYAVCLAGGGAALICSSRIPPVEGARPKGAGLGAQLAGLRALASSGPLLALGAVEAAVLFMYGTIEVFLPLYALGRGVGAFGIGACLSAQVITLAATKPAMGRLSDRRGRRGQILWGAALGAAACAGIAAATGFFAFLLFSILVGFSLSVVTSATAAAVADRSRCEERGSAMGLFGTIMDIGHSAGPILSGAAAALLGLRAAFVGAAILLVIAAAAFGSLPAGKRAAG